MAAPSREAGMWGVGLVPAFVSGAAEGESAGQELRSGHTALAAHCPRKTVWWGVGGGRRNWRGGGDLAETEDRPS